MKHWKISLEIISENCRQNVLFFRQGGWGKLETNQKHLIFCPITSQLAFLNWRSWRGSVRWKVGSISSSVTTAQWSEIRGTLGANCIEPVLFVIAWFKILSSLVSCLWIWAKACVSRLDKSRSQRDLFVVFVVLCLTPSKHYKRMYRLVSVWYSVCLINVCQKIHSFVRIIQIVQLKSVYYTTSSTVPEYIGISLFAYISFNL